MKNKGILEEKDLIDLLTYYRLLSAKKIVQADMESIKLGDSSKAANFFDKMATEVKNAFKNNNLDNLYNEKKTVEDAIENFKKSANLDLIQEIAESKEDTKEAIDQYIKSKKDLTVIYRIALLIANTNGYSHPREDKTLKVISELLFNDEDKINDINDEFQKTFREVGGYNKGYDFMKNVIPILGISLVTTSLINGAVFGIAGIATGLVAHTFANLATSVYKKGFSDTDEITLASALTATAGSFLCINKELREMYLENKEYKEMIRKMPADNLACSLAIELTSLDFVRTDIDVDTFKNTKDFILDEIQSKRDDLEYFNAVEENNEDYKKKIEIYNRAVAKLAQIHLTKIEIVDAVKEAD